MTKLCDAEGDWGGVILSLLNTLEEIRNNLNVLNENVESTKKSIQDIAYYFNTRIEQYEKEGKPL